MTLPLLGTDADHARHIACRLLDHRVREFAFPHGTIECCPLCEKAEYQAYKWQLLSMHYDASTDSARAWGTW